MLIKIHGYIFQTPFHYLSIFFVYLPIFVSISRLSTSISIYHFVNPPLFFYTSVNPDWCLSFFISLLIQIHGYIFQTRFLYLSLIFCISTYICFYLLSIHPYFFIPLCQSILMPISFYLFVNPNSRLYLSMFFSLFQYTPHLFTSISFYLFINPNPRFSLSILFSLSLSILRLSTYMCFSLLSNHLYIFKQLYQSRLMPICFYLFVNPNPRFSLSILFYLSLSILRISTYICFYLL